MERDTSSDKFPLGSSLPEFDLPAVDGTRKGSSYFKDAPAALVFFSCNHCPYVKGSEQMVIDIVRRFETKGLRTLSISSNDAVQYPEDGMEKMKEKARAMNLPYPYLYDETQRVARSFDAACTPEFYLFDRSGKLVYHGAVNDSPRDPAKVTKDFLSEAVAAVLDGKTPQAGFVHPIGCSIKWKA